jgi:hypothetical protein
MLTWNQVVFSLSQAGRDGLARVPTHCVEHPRDAGLRQTFGTPHGQRSSYRAFLTNGCTLCVEDFGTFYEARLERSPRTAALGRRLDRARQVSAARRETTSDKIVGLTAFGALLGLALGGDKESALTGALIGGASALATVAVSDASHAPEASRAAVDFAKALVASSAGRKFSR